MFDGFPSFWFKLEYKSAFWVVDTLSLHVRVDERKTLCVRTYLGKYFCLIRMKKLGMRLKMSLLKAVIYKGQKCKMTI
jgi:hypothetical protein